MLDRTWIAIGAAGAALFSIPFLHLPAFYESFLYLVLHWIVLATSWNLLSGYAGYVSFGHGAFFGAGVYATAVLAGTYNVPFLWTLPAAAGVAALLGAALGAVAFRVKRVRGELFALLTLAVTFVLATIVQNTPIDGGPGVYLSAVAVPALAPTTSGTFYMLALVLAIASVTIARGIARARLGLGLFAIHDDEDVAEVMGVPTFRYKLVAFALSCALAGAAGGIHARVRVVRDDERHVQHHRAADRGADERAGRHASLGGAAHRRHGDHDPALCVDRGRPGRRRQGRHRRHPGRRGAVHARRHPRPVAHAARRSVGARMPRRAGRAGAPTCRRCARRRATASPAPVAVPHRAAAAVARGVADGGRVAATLRTATGAAPMLAVRGLRKAFKGVRALDGIDLDIREGEIVGVIGPNGSGKSTLINVVSGHFRADAGSLAFRGHDIAAWPAHRIARAGIARTYQVPRPFAQLDVHDNVALTAMFGAAALDRRAAPMRPPRRGSRSPGSRAARAACPARSTCTKPSFSSSPARSPRRRAC